MSCFSYFKNNYRYLKRIFAGNHSEENSQFLRSMSQDSYKTKNSLFLTQFVSFMTTGCFNAMPQSSKQSRLVKNYPLKGFIADLHGGVVLKQ